MAEPVTIHFSAQIPNHTRLYTAVLLAFEAAAKDMLERGAKSHHIVRAARWLAESYSTEVKPHA